MVSACLCVRLASLDTFLKNKRAFWDSHQFLIDQKKSNPRKKCFLVRFSLTKAPRCALLPCPLRRGGLVIDFDDSGLAGLPMAATSGPPLRSMLCGERCRSIVGALLLELHACRCPSTYNPRIWCIRAPPGLLVVPGPTSIMPSFMAWWYLGSARWCSSGTTTVAELVWDFEATIGRPLANRHEGEQPTM